MELSTRRFRVVLMDFIIVFLILFAHSQVWGGRLQSKYAFVERKKVNQLFWFHLLFFFAYFTYAHFNRSDSHHYYLQAVNTSFLGWLSYFRTSTPFIQFLAVPITKVGLSYMGTMFVFAYMGYMGFVYAYLFFAETIPSKIKVFGRYDFLGLLLFLPNMHFWSASLGKGSVIFMGLMMFVFALKKPKKRILLLLIAGFVVYMVRPHMMLFLLVGLIVGLFLGREKTGFGMKTLIALSSFLFLFYFSDNILAVANLEGSDNVVEDFKTFAEDRSDGLQTKGSGVDMNSYPLPFKLFTFWFRPLFLDSPNLLGIFSSLENLVYLLLFLKVVNKRFVRFIRKAPALVKMSAVTFFSTSFAMTFIMSNLGIIMRQKAMVMYFGFFVIYYFLAWEQQQRELASGVEIEASQLL